MEEFNKYDVRGRIGRLNIMRLARAFSCYLQGGEIYLAHDERVGRKTLEEFIEGLLKSGTGVSYLGQRLSPELYFIQKAEPLSGAVMITRSHIEEENIVGFKFMKGEKFLCEDEIKRLESLYEKDNFNSTKTGEFKEKDTDIYFTSLKKMFTDLGNLRIGTNNLSFALFFFSLKAELISITEEFNDYLDILILTDGDGDRLSIVTKNGKLSGDALFSFFIMEEKIRGNEGLVLIEDKCSPTLFELCESLSFSAEPVSTGHSIIKNKMSEKKALLAGEVSGHFYFKERSFIDDALYGALIVLETLKERRRIAAWEGLPSFISGEIRGLAKKPFKEKKIFDKQRTFAVLKKSQTEPMKFVVKVESDSKKMYEKVLNQMLEEVGF